MKPRLVHRWNVSTQAATRLQDELRLKLETRSLLEPPVKKIVGVDASYGLRDDAIFAAAVSVSFPDLAVLEEKVAVARLTFPYVPGLLAFREGPALVKALEQIESEPDLIMVDGQGIAHPRGIGIASHLGIIFQTASIGVAKTSLVGTHKEPGEEPGSYAYVRDGRRIIGAALRTRARVKPVFVSVGFGVELTQALEIVTACTSGYRSPEPLRSAHILSNRARRTSA